MIQQTGEQYSRATLHTVAFLDHKTYSKYGARYNKYGDKLSKYGARDKKYGARLSKYGARDNKYTGPDLE
jgi:hypothetical protein